MDGTGNINSLPRRMYMRLMFLILHILLLSIIHPHSIHPFSSTTFSFSCLSLSSLFTDKVTPHSIPLHQVTDGGRAVINKGFLTSVERRKRSVTKTYDDAFYKGMENSHTEPLFFIFPHWMVDT